MNCSRSVTHTFLKSSFVLLSCCSIFNDRFAITFATALILYHIHHNLSIPFLKVFSTFFRFFHVALCGIPPSLADSFDIIPLLRMLVNSFFYFFVIFSIFIKIRSFCTNKRNVFCVKSTNLDQIEVCTGLTFSQSKVTVRYVAVKNTVFALRIVLLLLRYLHP